MGNAETWSECTDSIGSNRGSGNRIETDEWDPYGKM